VVSAAASAAARKLIERLRGGSPGRGGRPARRRGVIDAARARAAPAMLVAAVAGHHDRRGSPYAAGADLVTRQPHDAGHLGPV
jgi:hypothetical protein